MALSSSFLNHSHLSDQFPPEEEPPKVLDLYLYPFTRSRFPEAQRWVCVPLTTSLEKSTQVSGHHQPLRASLTVSRTGIKTPVLPHQTLQPWSPIVTMLPQGPCYPIDTSCNQAQSGWVPAQGLRAGSRTSAWGLLPCTSISG